MMSKAVTGAVASSGSEYFGTSIAVRGRWVL